MWTHRHSIRSGWSCGHPLPRLNNSGQRVGGGRELHVHTLPLGPTACEDIIQSSLSRTILQEEYKKKGTQDAADSLIGRARQGSARAFYGVQAAIQPLHALVNSPKLTHADGLQLKELTLVAWQHEGLDSSSLPEKQTQGVCGLTKRRRLKGGTDVTEQLNLQFDSSQRISTYGHIFIFFIKKKEKSKRVERYFVLCLWRFLWKIPEVRLAAYHFGHKQELRRRLMTKPDD